VAGAWPGTLPERNIPLQVPQVARFLGEAYALGGRSKRLPCGKCREADYNAGAIMPTLGVTL